ncbi:1-deoxy-D-xylulose-5-phosphate synthase [compost metagenome]
MLEWSTNQTEHPVVIRVPSKLVISTGVIDNTDYSILNKFKVEEKGEKVAIIGLGSFFKLGKELKDRLNNELSINATLINPKYITGVDKELLKSLASDHDMVITLEEGELDGGFGEKISRFYGLSNMKVLNLGAEKEFADRVSIDELYTRYNLKID